MLEAAVYTYVRVEAAEGIATITLINPEKRNSLSMETMRELTAALERAGGDRRSAS